MKILIAHCCGELVVPYHEANRPRHCQCMCSAVWWTNPSQGHLSVYSLEGPKFVSVLGLNNDFLCAKYPESRIDPGEEFGCIQRDQIEKILDDCPPNYLFHSQRSNIIKFRPDFKGIAGVKFISNAQDVPPDK